MGSLSSLCSRNKNKKVKNKQEEEEQYNNKINY